MDGKTLVIIGAGLALLWFYQRQRQADTTPSGFYRGPAVTVSPAGPIQFWV